MGGWRTEDGGRRMADGGWGLKKKRKKERKKERKKKRKESRMLILLYLLVNGHLLKTASFGYFFFYLN